MVLLEAGAVAAAAATGKTALLAKVAGVVALELAGWWWLDSCEQAALDEAEEAAASGRGSFGPIARPSCAEGQGSLPVLLGQRLEALEAEVAGWTPWSGKSTSLVAQEPRKVRRPPPPLDHVTESQDEAALVSLARRDERRPRRRGAGPAERAADLLEEGNVAGSLSYCHRALRRTADDEARAAMEAVAERAERQAMEDEHWFTILADFAEERY